MKLAAILNSGSGTLKTLEPDEILEVIETQFSQAGYGVNGCVTSGEDFQNKLDEAVKSDADVVLVGGGDGSISSAAAQCWENRKTLAVLPAGTMNLFARGLRIPLDLNEAIQALAGGRPIACDLATANGRPFIHQYSIGMHPQLVEERNQYNFDSRLTKIFASFRAFTSQVANPPTVRTIIKTIRGERDELLSNLSVSNNPYGDGHLPYFDDPSSGKLGIYTAGVLDVASYLSLATDLAAGSWRSNSDIQEEIADKVELEFPEVEDSGVALIDGELLDLESRVTIESHPGALTVLAPQETADLRDDGGLLASR